MGKLKNKAAVITGGAGDIGFATAEQFVKEGAKVLLVDIKEKELKRCSKIITGSCHTIDGGLTSGLLLPF